MQAVHLRKYGVEAKIPFELYEVDGVNFRTDAADAGSDCTIMKDEGAEATCTNDFVDEGMGYSLTLSSTEMQAARIMLYIVDSATKVWLDKAIVIETYGHASAQHAMDFDDAVRGGMTALPNAAADAGGGLPISDAGSLDLDNLKTAIVDEWETQSQADPSGFYVNVREWLGVVVTVSTGDCPEVNVKEISQDSAAADNLEAILDGTGGVDLKAQSLTITGGALGLDINGTTAAMKLSGGTTGIGLDINGGSSSGVAVDIDSTSGTAVAITSADATALYLSGVTHGLEIAASAGPGVEIDGTTFGIECDASAGPGIHVGGTTYGFDIDASNGPAFSAVSSGGNGNGISASGNGTGHGMSLTGGTSGVGLVATAGASGGAGASFTAAGSGVGLQCTGNGGAGLYATGGDGYAAFHGVGGGMTNGEGMLLEGAGTDDGLKIVGGATGHGIQALGGASSGAGIYAAAQANNDAGMELVKHGTGKDLDAGWPAEWDAEVQSEVNDALIALNLDHLMKTAVANNADMTTEVADGTVLSNVMSKTSDTSTYVVADDSLQGLADGAAGGGATVDQILDELLSGHTVSGSVGAALGDVTVIGTGAITHTHTVTGGGNPQDNVAVWVTTDAAGANVIAGTKYTNSSGEVTFQLDAGTYYFWHQKAEWDPDENPKTVAVS